MVCSSSVLPRPASSGILLEMQFLEPHSRPPESETRGWDTALGVLTSPPGDSDACESLRPTDLENESSGKMNMLPTLWYDFAKRCRLPFAYF